MTSGVDNNPQFNTLQFAFAYATITAPMDFRPGQKWEYNNTGLALLAPCFRQPPVKASTSFSTRGFWPIGIASADWSWDRNSGLAIPYSGLHITPGLARFGLLVLRGGRWQEQQIVPADWLAAAVRPSQSLEKSYGYLWWNNTGGKWPACRPTPLRAGHRDNDMLIVPSLDLIVIRQVGERPVTSMRSKSPSCSAGCRGGRAH